MDAPASPLSLAQLVAALGRDFQDSDQMSDSWLQDAELFCKHADDRRAEFLAIFDGHEPTAVEFYKRFNVIAPAIRSEGVGDRLLGKIWALALHGKDDGKRAEFLDGCFTGHRAFFDWLPAMPTLVASIHIPANIAEPWFSKIFEKVQRDGANAPFFVALAVYATTWPQEALSLVEAKVHSKRVCCLDSIESTVCGNLLAGLHHATLSPSDVDRIKVVETALSTSRQVSHRATLWLARRCRFLAGSVSELEVAGWFDELTREVSELRIEGFHLASAAVRQGAADTQSLSHALRWLQLNATAPLSDNERHQLLHILSSLIAPENRQRVGKTACLHELLRRLLPLPQGENDLWISLDWLLRAVIKNAPAELGPVLRTLVSGGSELVDAVRHNSELTCLRDSLHTPDGIALITQFCFSRSENERDLGLALFEVTGLTEFPSQQIAELDQRVILMIIYQFQRMPLATEVVSRFFLALLPRIATCSEEVQHGFFDELLYQAKNLPKACLETLRQCPEPSPRLQCVISEADVYFKALHECADSPLVHMDVPHLRGAQRIQARRFSQTMSEGVRRKASILDFFHNVQLIYGDAFSSYRDGAIGEPTPMQAIRHEIEIPRFLLMDPEGTALRRLTASVRIQQLAAEIGGNE